MMNRQTPTLDELLTRLSTDIHGRDVLREVYAEVASGNRHPTSPPLPENVVVLACQAMVILLDHIDATHKGEGGE
jgi:hypothetical protein